MTQYRVGEQGAMVVSSDGHPIVRLRPGYVIEGDIAHSCIDSMAAGLAGGVKAAQAFKEAVSKIQVEPKMRRGRSDKALRAERDYEDKSL